MTFRDGPDLPLTEQLLAVLASGEAVKRKSLKSQLRTDVSEKQLDSALQRLLQDGRARRTRPGYFQAVSPYEMEPIPDFAPDSQIIEFIERYSRVPTTFEELTRSQHIARSALWRCVAWLVQVGRLRIARRESEMAPIRFARNVIATGEDHVEPAPETLNAILRAGCVYRMSELERVTRSTSRMLLNKFKHLFFQEQMHSFIIDNRRYVLVISDPLYIDLKAPLFDKPKAIILELEFDRKIIEVLNILKDAFIFGKTPAITSDQELHLHKLIRAGMARLDPDTMTQITKAGLTLLERRT